MNKCWTCEHFIGGGDWNLCCNIPHPTPKEKEIGMKFISDIYVIKTQKLVICMSRKEINYVG